MMERRPELTIIAGSEMVVNMVNEFKAAGFKVTLCYFGLVSEDDSVSSYIESADRRSRCIR
jgi:hypothetical protein